MKFLLTIDTEGDNQWDHGRDLTVENIKFVPRFQELCNKYLIKPVYLVTSEVCEDSFARKIFPEYLSSGQAEIGTHLHSWTTPPFLDKDGFRFNDVSHAYASEIPEELLIEKLKNLTAQIEAAFGKRPASFRSGRYGFNDTVARILSENSYLVDSSVSPYTNWTFNPGLTGGIGGPDFSGMTSLPYVYKFGENRLVEIPITVLPTKFPLNRSHSLAEFYFRNVYKSLGLRVLRKFIFKGQPVWLRPFDWMTMDLFEEIINEASWLKLEFIVMMFHSSELMPGCSKYRPDQESVERLYKLLENFFILLKQKDIISVTLTDASKNINV